MREIKLRAWDKKKKRFLSQEEMTEIGGFYYNYGVTPKPDEFDLLQFTGLLDKNGKEICEGDIVKLLPPNIVKSEEIKEVEWMPMGCVDLGWHFVGNGEGRMLQSDEESEYEIIGNTYENPELLT